MKYLVIISCASLLLTSCAKPPPTDKNGDLPKDVFDKFLQAVTDDDIELAKSFWDDEPNRANGGGRGKFSDVFAWWKQFDEVKVVGSYEGKTTTYGRTYYHVVTECYVGETKKHWPHPALYLLNDEWKLHRNIWW